MTAEWRAACLSEYGEYDVSSVEQPLLRALEARIVDYLKPSWCSAEKARLLLEVVVVTKPAIAVEVGAFTGSSTLPMVAGLRHLGEGHAWIVDAWSNEEAVRGLPAGEVNMTWWSGLDMSGIKRQFDQLVGDWSLGPYCQVLAEPSRNAAGRVEAIDFLNLDGNFSPEGARLDSELFLPRVRSGGFALMSNALVTVGGTPTKLKALWPFFDSCDLVCELDDRNTLLFRKR